MKHTGILCVCGGGGVAGLDWSGRGVSRCGVELGYSACYHMSGLSPSEKSCDLDFIEVRDFRYGWCFLCFAYQNVCVNKIVSQVRKQQILDINLFNSILQIN